MLTESTQTDWYAQPAFEVAAPLRPHLPAPCAQAWHAKHHLSSPHAIGRGTAVVGFPVYRAPGAVIEIDKAIQRKKETV